MTKPFLSGLLMLAGTLLLSPNAASAADASADLTALLARNPTFSDVQISPDGRFLAVAVYKDDQRQLLCLKRDTLEAVGGLRLSGKDEVGNFFWANDERLVLKIMSRSPWEKQAKYYGELFGVNCDGSRKELLFGYRVDDQHGVSRNKAMRAWADIVHRLPDDPKNILISSTKWSKDQSAKAEIFSMDIYTGQLKKFGKTPIGYADIVAGKDGTPRVVSGVDEHHKQRVYLATADGEWQESQLFNGIDQFTALRMLEDQSGFYFYGRYQRDLAGLYRYNFQDASIEPLYEPKNVDVTHAMFTTDGQSIYAARLDENYPSYLLLSKTAPEAAVFRHLAEQFAGIDVQLTSRTADGKLWVVRVEADMQPPVYFLYDSSNKKLGRLVDSYPHLRGAQLAESVPVEFDSTDQFKVHGYLTQGAAKDGKKPLVVLLHGGPYGVRDYWGYNAEVQMLAAAGFNVLQVNFRASAGYGEKFADAADRHWGDTVQQDILAGVRWAVGQGVATAGNICLMGSSFGAYAALQSATLAPELFKCAVGVAGIYDLTLLTKKGDITRLAYGEAYLDRAVGTDEAQLKAFSPVYQAGRIQANVLLIHGERDERAPLIHAEKMQEALEKAGKKVQFSEYDDETHGFYAEKNQIRYFNEVKTFLQGQLQR